MAMKPKVEFESNGRTPGNQYRIYKPLFLDPNNLKRDLDREFEAVSQSLIWVTGRLKQIEEGVNLLFRAQVGQATSADVVNFLKDFDVDSSNKTLWPKKKV
ncbi:hypothetical protein [Herbiconiux daphne]|uniref:Uncharacterized protein n=1 Tax=Herbiconiux daphne TaxID=2970914 RepID=A0ABT2HA59_9MICO|nr:hypothetical protein [Herbiconiux daphne]MCS5736752.1 hypothetical protein [Herbiconiux daphne]